MKREERKVYNNLKKTVSKSTLYVEIPVTWTHEARQAIHELLTIEKGMIVSCIGPDVITLEDCARYIHANEYTQKTRQQQEVTDIDTVAQAVRHTDYTWNGYRRGEL